MGRNLPKIKVPVLAKSIVGRLLNKFDSIVAIEGGTGQSKSTLAIHIARAVSFEFKKLFDFNETSIEYYYDAVVKRQGKTIEQFIEMLIEWKEKKFYKYNPYADLIYDHPTMLKGLSSWHRIIIPDEAILLSHNRDFQGQEQKKIIKMVNVYRDHGNLVLMCIPNFNTMDVQLKGMCRMRISVARRGIAIVQTPNKTFYGRDKWESALNEKIEKEYLMKNPNRPAFAKLTTARAIVTYRKLSDKLEAQYQAIKNEKRGKFEEDIGAKEVETKEKPKDAVEVCFDRLLNDGIKNFAFLEGYATSCGLDINNLKRKLEYKLRKLGKPTALSHYFWDRKERKRLL